MKTSARVSLFCVGVALVCLGLFVARDSDPPSNPPASGSGESAKAPAAPTPPTTSASTKESRPASTWSPEEIFRRAFWRHPASADQILHAERREGLAAPDTAPDGTSASVVDWQWFLALKPGTDLLRTLRDPETFGLLPLTPGEVPRPWAATPPPPDWFPALSEVGAYEIHQNPALGLTLLYRARDNTLFATDAGRGFTAAVKPATP